MRHARPDYNRIQDPAGLIPEDEPVFLFRAQDKHAVAALRAYARSVLRDRNGDPQVILLTEAWIREFRAWPKKKNPDIK